MADHQFEITLTEDVAAPAQAVFAHVTDFDDLARQLRERGARVERLADTAAGMPAWRVRIAWRGVERDLRIEIAEQTADELLRATVASAEFAGDIHVTVAASGQKATRLTVTGRAGGATLPARMLLQSLRLGQGRIAANLQRRLRRFCDRIERAARR